MQKIMSFISKYQRVLIIVAVVTSILSYDPTWATQFIFFARLLGLIRDCFISVIGYFLTYGYFIVIYKLFGKMCANMRLPYNLTGKKFVILFSNFAIVMSLFIYIFSVLLVFIRMSGPFALMDIAALLGIIKFRNREDVVSN